MAKTFFKNLFSIFLEYEKFIKFLLESFEILCTYVFKEERHFRAEDKKQNLYRER